MHDSHGQRMLKLSVQRDKMCNVFDVYGFPACMVLADGVWGSYCTAGWYIYFYIRLCRLCMETKSLTSRCLWGYVQGDTGRTMGHLSTFSESAEGACWDAERHFVRLLFKLWFGWPKLTFETGFCFCVCNAASTTVVASFDGWPSVCAASQALLPCIRIYDLFLTLENFQVCSCLAKGKLHLLVASNLFFLHVMWLFSFLVRTSCSIFYYLWLFRDWGFLKEGNVES